MSTDLSKLASDSANRIERVVLKSSIPFSLAAFGIGTFSVSHNLGYYPYIKAYYTYGDGKYFRLFAGAGSYAIDGNGGQVDNEDVTTTAYSVTISENNGAAISGRIYYRIYAEPQT